jgi:hypothetical protein
MKLQGAAIALLFTSLALAVPQVERRDWASQLTGSVSVWPGPPSTCQIRIVYTTATIWPDSDSAAALAWSGSSAAPGWIAPAGAAGSAGDKPGSVYGQ